MARHNWVVRPGAITEVRGIAKSSSLLGAALQSSILLAIAVIYLALLSLPAFLLCAILIGSCMTTYLSESDIRQLPDGGTHAETVS